MENLDRQRTLAVIGEAVIDLIEEPDGRYTAHPGGSPLNVAVGLARLGEAVCLKARFSTGPFGRQLRNHAATSGVDLSYAVDVDAPATLAAVSLAENRAATYSFYVQGTADWQWTEEELKGLPADAQVLHIGSLGCLIAPGAPLIFARARAARAAGIIVSYDPNIRPLLAGGRNAVERVEEFVSSADLVKASKEDLAWLYPGREPHEIARRWLAAGASMAVVTLGRSGALVVTKRGPIHRAAPSVEVVDTVGAGDAFTAGLLSALVRSGARHVLETLDTDDVTSIVDSAILVAAVTCTRAGEPAHQGRTP